jgi:hypothetical protein
MAERRKFTREEVYANELVNNRYRLPPEPMPWWVRRRAMGGLGMFLVICALALLLSGCDFPRCGVLWPC